MDRPVTPPVRLLRSPGFVRAVLALPAFWPAVPLLRGEPAAAADPVKYLLHHYGFTACVMLAAVLCLTPLRILFPRAAAAAALNRHRRLIGVTAFVYALLHVAAYALYSGGPAVIVAELGKPFIQAGLTAFLILTLLALTSPHACVRWLGARRWKGLHRLAYLAAALAAWHQAAARKLFPVQVLWIFVPLAALEILRLWRTARRTPAPGVTAGR